MELVFEVFLGQAEEVVGKKFADRGPLLRVLLETDLEGLKDQGIVQRLEHYGPIRVGRGSDLGQAST